ncbi:hypothetical protein PybrP1_000171 [[Pythium] brassicae (nom. inval.)]|nr:hypothetical protein PybrP1_000171 [[Pythium] brassicae (nom. inval.)]
MSGGDLNADAALAAMQQATERLNAILRSLSDAQKSRDVGDAPEVLEDDDETFVHASEWPRADGADESGPDDGAAVPREADGVLETEQEPPISQSNYYDSYTRELAGQRELPEMLTMYLRGSFVDEAGDAKTSSEGGGDTVGHKAERAFFKLDVQTPFPRTRIVQAACSRFHGLLLSDLGMVFAFGHAVDGALGLGASGQSRDVVATPRLLDYFFDRLVTIRCVACGGDPMAGAHSAAVTTDGSVYTWGAGVALGNRSTRSRAEPQLVQLPPLEDSALKQLAPELHPPPSIQSVACGGGFCVAVAETGHAFAWGKWGDGRLGLGRIPILNQTSRRHGQRRQFQSFQLAPKQLSAAFADAGGRRGSERAALFVKVACGEAHCVGLTRRGALATWGRGLHGQLGLGDVSDAPSPVELEIAGERGLRWRDVAAGESWSLALDTHGRVWAWGACGGAVLGLGNSAMPRTAVVTEMILQRHLRLLKQQPTTGLAPPPLPRLDWMRPQLVPAFGSGEVRIEKLSAGRQHAAALSTDGDLYLWGDGNGFSSLPSLVRLTGAGSAAMDGDTPGAGPAAMGSDIVEHVVCGGDVALAFTSGSFLARAMQTLYRQCALLSREHQSLAPAAFCEVAARLATDVALIVSGTRLFAHKLVLARRSPVLRDLIQSEQRGGGGASSASGSGRQDETAAPGGAILELLLPQLRLDVASVLLEYMYTDNFSLMLDPQSYLVRDVQRAAQLYRLPALERLCSGLLHAGGAPSSPFPLEAAAVFPLETASVPTCLASTEGVGRQSLNADLQFVLGDPAWSDLTLEADGTAIPVHRCVLVARSAYFRALLGFGAGVSGSDGRARVVRVDESYAGIVRVLQFIYNDHIAAPARPQRPRERARTDDDDNQQEHEHEPREGDNDDDGDEEEEETARLLEDLVAADKYGLARFKRLCEHAVRVTSSNCLDVLAVADLVSASHLKQVALAFLQTHLQTMAPRPMFARFKDDYPHLLTELFEHIRSQTANESQLRDWHRAVEHQVALQREQEETEWKARAADAGRFPWLYLILTATFATLYLSVMSRQVHDHPLVPALNVVALLGVFGALFFGWL